MSYHISQYQNIISELRGEIGRLKEKIQSEAVFGGPSSGVKKAELQEMREQMVTNFKEQMNLRYFHFFHKSRNLLREFHLCVWILMPLIVIFVGPD